MKHITFSRVSDTDFAETLKRRINLYFKLSHKDKKANTGMKLKTAILMSLYLAPIALHWFGIITSPWLVIVLYTLSGFGLAGIGMGIMHDANHGAYTRNKFTNYMLAHTLDFLGCSSALWKYQHNVLHHTYTNIHGHDEDIDAPLWLLRFSPHSKRYKIQRFQHWYVWIFYSFLTLYWFAVKDFYKAIDYRKMGLITSNKEMWWRLIKLVPTKAAYVTYALILPMWLTPLPFYWVLFGFLIMHAIASVLLSVVFQLAHVMPEMEFPEAEGGDQLEVNWYVHQLQTTSNFSPRNRFLQWYLGGLTNQIEHHLFPNICHVHYRNLSRIVEKTAKEFNVPYHVNKSFFSAVAGHVRTLRSLGRVQLA